MDEWDWIALRTAAIVFIATLAYFVGGAFGRWLWRRSGRAWIRRLREIERGRDAQRREP